MENRRNTLYLMAIISLLVGLFTGKPFFLNLAFLLIGLLILAYIWAWLSVRGIGVSRRTRSKRSQVGRLFKESFTVTNKSFLPKLWIEVRDYSNLPNHRASHVVPGMRSRSTHTWEANTPCQVRGEFRLGPLSIMSGDPFGFYSMPRPINATERIVIYPMIVPISNFHLPMGVLTGGEAQRRFTHQITTNAAGVREYVPGDSFNRIHWKSTARRGQIIVKEFEIDPLVDIWLFTDFSSKSLIEDSSIQRIGGIGAVIPDSSEIPASTEEYSVVITASLARYFMEKERSMGYVAYTPHREYFQADRGSRHLNRILQSLAVARSLSTRSLREMLSLETHYLSRGTTLIIVSSSTDPEWVIETQMLSSRGIRPMVIYVNPQSFDPSIETDEVKGLLQLGKIPTLYVNKGQDLSQVLQQRPII
ncbi:DUF58 domain-containing protein [Anaerolineales bacterium]